MGNSFHREPHRPSVSLAELEREAHTGDVLLFKGTSLFSRAEELANWSEFGHVAIVYRHRKWGLCVWESSTRDDTADLLTGGSDKDGPRLIRLRAKLQIYVRKWGSGVVWRRLRLRKGVLAPDWQKRLSAFVAEVHDRSFERHFDDMARSLVKWLPGGTRGGDLTSLFCSETVAESYKRMGLFPEDTPADHWTVIDFSEGEDQQLPWPRDERGRRLAWLGPETEIEIP